MSLSNLDKTHLDELLLSLNSSNNTQLNRLEAVKANHAEYAQKVERVLKNKDFRAISDLRNEKIGFKIREHTLRKVPYQLVVGDKEMESQKISVRRRDGEDLGLMDLESFVSLLEEDVAEKGRVALANKH